MTTKSVAGHRSNRIEAEGDRRHDAMANMLARPETLVDYLHHQLSWFEIDERVRRMADRVIYSLDTNGYLKTPLEELLPPLSPELNGDLQAHRAKQMAIAEEALRVVQRLDPPGVGARTLKECLMLQLLPGMPFYDELQEADRKSSRRFGKQSPAADLEEDRHVDRKDSGSVARAAQAQAEAGRRLHGHDRPERDAGRVRRAQRRRQIPSAARRRPVAVAVSSARTTASCCATRTPTPETREYIKRKVNSAQWLIESIEQRRSTLTRVSQAIVDHQTKFLDDGPDHIEPLKMQQIADKVGVHVTTVSRAVDDKWMQTPRGIFPLKRFFVGGTTAADGEEVAWDRVRIKLQEIIDNEDKKSSRCPMMRSWKSSAKPASRSPAARLPSTARR